MSYKWRRGGAHINELEVLASYSALKWRARKARYVPQKYLHLLDSQVAIAVLVKHRSTSRVLYRICIRHAITELVGGLYPVYAYVRTDDNPADEPSRTLIAVRRRAPPILIDDDGQ